MPAARARRDRRRDDLPVLVAEHAVLAGVRVQPADRDPRGRDADPAQRVVHRAHDPADPFFRHELDRAPQAHVQGRVRDPHPVEADHEERIVHRHAGAARDERRIAVELDARCLDREFGLRRSDHRRDIPCHRGLDRRARRLHGGAAVRRANLADRERLVAEVIERDRLDVRRDPRRRRVRRDRARIAEEHRPADARDALVERRLERDLRADAGRIADRDADARKHAYTLTGSVPSGRNSPSFAPSTNWTSCASSIAHGPDALRSGRRARESACLRGSPARLRAARGGS